MEPETKPSPRVLELVVLGNQALERGAWTEARDLFDEALGDNETPEALEGLGRACWWLDDVTRVAEARERAYRAYRHRGDARGAARIALELAEDALIFRAEEAVWNGWTERARRLLADAEPSPEHAVLATRDAFFAFMLAADMQRARQRAGDAIEIAKHFQMFDLEMLARAIDGVARVAEGEVAEGMRILDEATAAATSGEMRDIELIGNTCCFMIYGCERVRDFSRAAQWCERVREFSERNGLTSLLGVCRTHYAMVLAFAGAWNEAEAELVGATEQLALRPAQAAEGVARLGELRRRQGRHEEAMRLFEEVAFLPEAQIGRGLLALDQRDYSEAANIAERLLRQIPSSDRMQRVYAYELTARARAALGSLEAAREALAEIEWAADAVGTAPVRAAAAFTAGVVALSSDEPDRARNLLEDAIDLFARTRMPYESAEARLLLARAFVALGHHDRAEGEALRAAETFSRLGAAYAEKVARETLLPPPPPPTGRSTGTLTRREREILALVGEGLGDKGIAERLTISEHTVHRHMSNILTKLNVPSRAAAAAQAARLGIL